MKTLLKTIAIGLMALVTIANSLQSQLIEKTNFQPLQAELAPQKDADLFWGHNWQNPATSQNGIINTQFGGIYGDNHVVTADDFVIPEGEIWSITSIWARGFLAGQGGVPYALPDGFGVRIYEDDNDNPGDLVIDYLDANNNFDPAQPKINFSNPLHLTEGKYWIAVYGYFENSTDLEEGAWYQYMWNPEPSVGADARVRDYADLFGMFYNGWMILIEDLNINFSALDFAIWGTHCIPPDNFFNVTFNLDMSGAHGFDPDHHEVYIAGSFDDHLFWAEPGTQPELMLERVDDTMIFTLYMELAAGEYEYKFFSTHVGPGWYGGEWPGSPNRTVAVIGNMVVDHTWSPFFHQVTFYLNMEGAEDFNPDLDAVYITGSMFGWAEPGYDAYLQEMNRIGNTMVWENTLWLQSGDYSYKYYLNEGWDGAEWTEEPDRQIMVSAPATIHDTWGDPGGTFIANTESVNVQLYPNPASNHFTIKSNSTITNVRIIDITGRTVFSQAYEQNKVHINLEAFDKGLYIVQLFSGEGMIWRKLMVK